jgi:hypothetical protein
MSRSPRAASSSWTSAEGSGCETGTPELIHSVTWPSPVSLSSWRSSRVQVEPTELHQTAANADVGVTGSGRAVCGERALG